MAEPEDMVAAYREFIRENTLRVERAMRSISADIRKEVRLARDESREYFELQKRRTDELIEESRAQRQALLRIVDRLVNGGPAPAA